MSLSPDSGTILFILFILSQPEGQPFAVRSSFTFRITAKASAT